MALHEDQLEANRIDLQSFNTAAKLAGGDVAMDAIILPLTSVGGPTTAGSLQKAVLEIPVHEDQKYALNRIANKAIERDRILLTLDNTNVPAADTTAGVRALYLAQDARLLGQTTQQGGVLAGE